MTRLTEYLLPTEKQAPADAEAVSHKLLVRAGMIRQVGAGLWTYLPAGWRVHQRAVQIIREEMNAIGGQEMLMPTLTPADLWKRSGRWAIDELFKLSDRKDAEMLLAMSHEETVTHHMASLVRSYRDLPQILYHFQNKGRDEPRPRAAILRTREFIMKDAYSFDRDLEGLEASYAKHVVAYDRIFDRSGLEWYRVESDVGAMGGFGAHEYMAPCAAGENDVVLAPGYTANLEVASAEPQPGPRGEERAAPESVHTPGQTTVAAVSAALEVPATGLLKAFPVIVEGRGLVVAVVRGDHQVNEIKLANALGAACRPAVEAEFAQALGPAGYIGPVGAQAPVLLDRAVAASTGGWVCGANQADTHLRGVQPGRDFPFEHADIRSVVAGDTVGGHAVRIEPAIEIGNIFKLGTRYSEPLEATYLDDAGKAQHIWMGSYGIGPARIAAAAVEQTADDHGIAWPRALSPFDVALVGLGKPGTPERDAADSLYAQLREVGLDVLYDDRDLGPGGKFADAELVGCPVRLTVGRRTLESGEVEVQVRRGRESSAVSLEGAATAAAELWRATR